MKLKHRRFGSSIRGNTLLVFRMHSFIEIHSWARLVCLSSVKARLEALIFIATKQKRVTNYHICNKSLYTAKPLFIMNHSLLECIASIIHLIGWLDLSVSVFRTQTPKIFTVKPLIEGSTRLFFNLKILKKINVKKCY